MEYHVQKQTLLQECEVEYKAPHLKHTAVVVNC